MKQKVVVRAILKQNGKTLLLRRRGGRPSIVGKYELPGGTIDSGEQPTDTLKRALMIHAGLAPETVQLFDVMSFVDPDDRELQYVFLLYLVGLPQGNNKVTLSNHYDKYIWKKKSELQQNDVTKSTIILLDLNNSHMPVPVATKSDKNIVDYQTTDKSKTIIYSDGGSRGNPGPSAAGYVIMNSQEEVLFEGGEYLGVMTNNLAEYQAVCLALGRAKQMGAKNIDFRVDSLLVVNQLNGIYRIRNRELWPIHDRIKELIKQFDKVSFTHVKREFNRLADGMVNRILDEKARSKGFVRDEIAKNAISSMPD